MTFESKCTGIEPNIRTWLGIQMSTLVRIEAQIDVFLIVVEINLFKHPNS